MPPRPVRARHVAAALALRAGHPPVLHRLGAVVLEQLGLCRGHLSRPPALADRADVPGRVVAIEAVRALAPPLAADQAHGLVPVPVAALATGHGPGQELTRA